MDSGFYHLNKDIDNYFTNHFDKIICSNISEYPKKFITAVKEFLSQDSTIWISYCNWLDYLWFAHYLQNE